MLCGDCGGDAPPTKTIVLMDSDDSGFVPVVMMVVDVCDDHVVDVMIVPVLEL